MEARKEDNMLRKKLLSATQADETRKLDLETLASFEVSSEAEGHPLENALNADETRWQASNEGPQTVRLVFDIPQDLSRIILLFEEQEIARTQEFAIFWKSIGDSDWREFRRQQFNFSPSGTTREDEDFQMALLEVTALELRITPSIGGGGKASLTYLALEIVKGAA
jgi:hypothetical protein